MPYIVTTTDGRGIIGEGVPGARPLTSRRAVATLDEAKREVGSQIAIVYAGEGAGHVPAANLDKVVEHGGSIGPLPDGTVIEVEHVSWLDMAASIDTDTDAESGRVTDDEAAEIIAAYNAAQ